MSIKHLTGETFDSEISDGNVLVDFWAGWCMPCKMLAPVIEELDAEFGGQVAVAKVDVDDEQGLAMRFNVMTIPTVILFKGGVEAKRFIGVQPKGVFTQELSKL